MDEDEAVLAHGSQDRGTEAWQSCPQDRHTYTGDHRYCSFQKKCRIYTKQSSCGSPHCQRWARKWRADEGAGYSVPAKLTHSLCGLFNGPVLSDDGHRRDDVVLFLHARGLVTKMGGRSDGRLGVF